MRIAIADDKPGNRKILKEKLRINTDFRIVLEAKDGADFLEQLKKTAQDDLPEVVLMDLEMPNVNGIQAIATASSLFPKIHFIVLTIFDDDENIFNAIQAGACGYLLKEESAFTIMEMLNQLYESGAGPISPSIAYKILQMVKQGDKRKEQIASSEIYNLSEREKEILQLLSAGFEYKEIAQHLFISPNTVKKHAINIYEKLHVNGKAQALKIAYTKGLL